jgi:hypothetical protein
MKEMLDALTFHERSIKQSKHIKNQDIKCFLTNTSKAFPACGLSKTAKSGLPHHLSSAPQTFFAAVRYGSDCPGIDYPAEHLFEIFVADHSPAQTFDMRISKKYGQY